MVRLILNLCILFTCLITTKAESIELKLNYYLTLKLSTVDSISYTYQISEVNLIPTDIVNVESTINLVQSNEIGVFFTPSKNDSSKMNLFCVNGLSTKMNFDLLVESEVKQFNYEDHFEIDSKQMSFYSGSIKDVSTISLSFKDINSRLCDCGYEYNKQIDKALVNDLDASIIRANDSNAELLNLAYSCFINPTKNDYKKIIKIERAFGTKVTPFSNFYKNINLAEPKYFYYNKECPTFSRSTTIAYFRKSKSLQTLYITREPYIDSWMVLHYNEQICKNKFQTLKMTMNEILGAPIEEKVDLDNSIHASWKNGDINAQISLISYSEMKGIILYFFKDYYK